MKITADSCVSQSTFIVYVMPLTTKTFFPPLRKEEFFKDKKKTRKMKITRREIITIIIITFIGRHTQKKRIFPRKESR